MMFFFKRAVLFFVVFPPILCGMGKEYRVACKIEDGHLQLKQDWETGCRSVCCLSFCCLGVLCWKSQLKELRWLRELENRMRIYDKGRVQIPCLCQSVGEQSSYGSGFRDSFQERDAFYDDGCCLCYKSCCVGDKADEVEKYIQSFWREDGGESESD